MSPPRKGKRPHLRPPLRQPLRRRRPGNSRHGNLPPSHRCRSNRRHIRFRRRRRSCSRYRSVHETCRQTQRQNIRCRDRRRRCHGPFTQGRKEGPPR
ncbi:threonine dehydratase [Cryptococcus neoformans]|nr:threonine dehydratase [Cryptococcus neoformans var. grubii]